MFGWTGRSSRTRAESLLADLGWVVLPTLLLLLATPVWLHGLMLAGSGFLLVCVLLAALWHPRGLRLLAQGRQATGPRLEMPDEPDGLRQTIQHLSREAESEADSVTVPETADSLKWLSKATADLTPEQRAAVTLGSSLASRGVEDVAVLLSAVLLSGVYLMLGGVLVWFMAPLTARLIFIFWFFTTPVFWKLPVWRMARRAAEADLQVARVLDDPRQLVDALAHLEQAERQAAFSSPSRTYVWYFADRRKRLERALYGRDYPYNPHANQRMP